jgi:hypothetical protein
MTDSHEGSTELTDYTPNFILPRHGVITQDNWPIFAAMGFIPLPEWSSLNLVQALCGVEHVYTGDAYDREAGRPSHDKPGICIYADAEGSDIGADKLGGSELPAEWPRAWEKRLRYRLDLEYMSNLW